MTNNIDYTARDFQSLTDAMLSYASTAFPEWVPGSEGDFGVLLVELMAYMGDINNYYIDRAQREAYLTSASQPDSILQIASMLGYSPHEGQPAEGILTLKNNRTGAVTVPAGTAFATDFVPEIDGPIVFESTEDVVIGAGLDGAVPVIEGETKFDAVTGNAISLGDGTGLLDQSLRIPHPGVYVDTAKVFVAGEPWRLVNNLLDAGPDERVFSVRTDSTGYSSVFFGDGLNGRAPAIGLPITATYRVGVAEKGNVSAAIITQYFDEAIQDVEIAPTTEEMTGGTARETTDQIRKNAPRSFYSQQRAVTLEDYKNFSLGIPGVSKANAIANYWSSVSVFVLGPDGGAPTAKLKDVVLYDLQSRVLTGVSVSVSAPDFVSINVGSVANPVTVYVFDNYDPISVKSSVETALKKSLGFLNSEIGQRVSVSSIYRDLMSVEGVKYVSIPLMARSDAVQTGTNDVQLQAYEFPVLGTFNIVTSGGLL